MAERETGEDWEWLRERLGKTGRGWERLGKTGSG